PRRGEQRPACGRELRLPQALVVARREVPAGALRPPLELRVHEWPGESRHSVTARGQACARGRLVALWAGPEGGGGLYPGIHGPAPLCAARPRGAGRVSPRGPAPPPRAPPPGRPTSR